MAAKHAEPAPSDGELNGDELTAAAMQMTFVTKNVSEEEQAAAVAVLSQLRTDEMMQVKQVDRRANDPWRRSQRNPEGIREFTE